MDHKKVAQEVINAIGAVILSQLLTVRQDLGLKLKIRTKSMRNP